MHYVRLASVDRDVSLLLNIGLISLSTPSVVSVVSVASVAKRKSTRCLGDRAIIHRGRSLRAKTKGFDELNNMKRDIGAHTHTHTHILRHETTSSRTPTYRLIQPGARTGRTVRQALLSPMALRQAQLRPLLLLPLHMCARTGGFQKREPAKPFHGPAIQAPPHAPVIGYYAPASSRVVVRHMTSIQSSLS